MRASGFGKTGKGFTLIELVVVIAIVGILAAVALPRFISMQQQARIAKAQAFFGAVRAAAVLAHAGCLADTTNVCTRSGGSVTMEGALIFMVNGYPAANIATTTPGGIILASGINPADGVTVGVVGPSVTIDINGGTAPNCRVTYTQPTGLDVAPDIVLFASEC